jgi:hypothetical protein
MSCIILYAQESEDSGLRFELVQYHYIIINHYFRFDFGAVSKD